MKIVMQSINREKANPMTKSNEQLFKTDRVALYSFLQWFYRWKKNYQSKHTDRLSTREVRQKSSNKLDDKI